MGPDPPPVDGPCQEVRPRAGNEPVRLRYEGTHSLPGRPPVEIWTILDGPAAGASFSRHPRSQDLRQVAVQTALRFLPAASPPPAALAHRRGDTWKERSPP